MAGKKTFLSPVDSFGKSGCSKTRHMNRFQWPEQQLLPFAVRRCPFPPLFSCGFFAKSRGGPQRRARAELQNRSCGEFPQGDKALAAPRQKLVSEIQTR